ncbi:MAG: hypothetical protein ACM3SV_14160 [Betaproteobacteria bacterium]
MQRLIVIMAVLLLSACASYSGAGLMPGKAGLDDVLRTMGQPAMRWNNGDGSIQLSYPRGPSAPESYMVNIAPDGKLQSVRNVLEPGTLALIKPGMKKDDVLRLLGPSEPSWTMYFPARDELAWDWRYQENSEPAHFIVLLDNTTGVVRSTMVIVDPITSVE